MSSSEGKQFFLCKVKIGNENNLQGNNTCAAFLISTTKRFFPDIRDDETIKDIQDTDAQECVSLQAHGLVTCYF